MELSKQMAQQIDPNEDPKQARKSVIFDYTDISMLEDERRALVNKTSPAAVFIILIIMLFITVALIWASVAEVDEVTRAKGKVIPSSKIQVIQYLEGGIIKRINIAEGDIVDKDQILLVMDKTRFGAEYEQGLARKYALEGTIIRLKSEIARLPVVSFPDELRGLAPDVVASETELFKHRREELETNIATLKNSYDLAAKELSIIAPLVKKGIMSEIDLLKLKRTVNELQGQVDSAEKEFIAEAQEELTTKEAEYTSLRAELLATRDRMDRTVIRSPVYGKVVKLNVNTLGSVIKPGSDIVEILPLEDTLLIEADVKPEDIAFIHPNQKAVIKFSAYDFSIYGGLDAKVSYISGDTIRKEEGRDREEEYYKVLLVTEKNYLGDGQQESLPIIPGMLVTVDVLTGEKTIMDYLLKPFVRARYEALRER